MKEFFPKGKIQSILFDVVRKNILMVPTLVEVKQKFNAPL